ncbi:hypothetical protein KIN_03080 [Litoreibacter roseus]|uniref:Uncharacterized protein n=1 Tax=Litoreibacter roseus TaxID=2601869 RepID=A0A6N6JB08_9RHOB|nr:hypothetical protein KIN_03080 [Litoreibacter roseus]
MQQLADIAQRRTTSDVVFNYVYQEIISLEFMPGTKKYRKSRLPVALVYRANPYVMISVV